MQHQVHATDVWIDTQDGVRLHAWFVAREGARWVTLYLHGNAGNITHRLPHIQEIVAAGSSILILDYRGYGKSSGRPTEKGLYIDSEAAFAHLLGMGYRANQIIVHGESLGTAVARLGIPPALRSSDPRSSVHFRERRRWKRAPHPGPAAGPQLQFSPEDPPHSSAQAIHAR